MSAMGEAVDRDQFIANVRSAVEAVSRRSHELASPVRRRDGGPAGEDRFLLFRDCLEFAGGQAHRAAGSEKLREILGQIIAGRNRLVAWGEDLPAGTRQVLSEFGVEWLPPLTLSPSNAEQGIPPSITEAQVGITGALLGVAETGSVVLASRPGENLLIASLSSIHVVLLGIDQLVVTLGDAFVRVPAMFPEGLPGNVAFISGPSRSADIEQSLAIGAHGPMEVHVIVISS